MARRTRSATNNTNISVTDVDDDGVPGPHDRMRTQSENKYKEMDREENVRTMNIIIISKSICLRKRRKREI